MQNVTRVEGEGRNDDNSCRAVLFREKRSVGKCCWKEVLLKTDGKMHEEEEKRRRGRGGQDQLRRTHRTSSWCRYEAEPAEPVDRGQRQGRPGGLWEWDWLWG